MKLLLNIEALNMVGAPRIFIQELIIKTGQYRSSRFKMETALVVSQHSHGITGKRKISKFVTTTLFFSISPAPGYSPPITLEKISGAVRIMVLYLVRWN
jgi:hypothetical protein